MTKHPPVVLLAIDTQTKVCERYYGKIHTHTFEVEGALTQKTVDDMRSQPDGTGEAA